MKKEVGEDVVKVKEIKEGKVKKGEVCMLIEK
jgi:hypothetical protein